MTTSDDLVEPDLVNTSWTPLPNRLLELKEGSAAKAEEVGGRGIKPGVCWELMVLLELMNWGRIVLLGVVG